MKTLQYTILTAILGSGFALAVPSEINYQGVLTDSQGNLVNGNRTMSLKIYDAGTGGALLYSEELGNTPVNNGVYNFTFGANGTSNALATETVATTNGTSTSFQKILSATSVVDGSVSVTDGNYTWSQANGSSNDNDFGVAYSTSLRRVTATYYNGAPAAGRTITATYRTPASGVYGALDSDSQPWAEISVNGTPQTPRQRVLAVPFAKISSKSLVSEKTKNSGYSVIKQPPSLSIMTGNEGGNGTDVTWEAYKDQIYIPNDSELMFFQYKGSWNAGWSYGSPTGNYTVIFRFFIGDTEIDSISRTFSLSGIQAHTFEFSKHLNPKTYNIVSGFNNFIVKATKTSYSTLVKSGPNIGDPFLPSYAKIQNGSAQLWIIDSPTSQ
jgi:hypothetical protein